MRDDMYLRASVTNIVLASILLLLDSPIGAKVTPQFVFNRADFPTGKSPSSVTVADVNGDGRPDLIVTNERDNTVSVFLGKSTGVYGKSKNFATGEGPSSVIAGDFNHDGKIDLAVTSVSANTVSVLLGNGNGTFQGHTDYATGDEPLVLQAGDFNHDGNVDLAVLNFESNSVSILLGKGDGTFQPKVDYVVGTMPTAMVVQDLNGDGNVDLAVANSGGSSISILLGNADGTFKPATSVNTQSAPCGIAIGDLDGDKIPDLAVTHQDVPWGLTVLKGNGDGTFQAEQQVAQDEDTYQVQAADVNGDGKVDIVLTLVSGGGAMVFLGNGDLTFQNAVNYTTGGYPGAFVLQDVNGDGNLDLAVVDQDANTLTVLLGNGDGTFSPAHSLPTVVEQGYTVIPWAGTMGDFNADGIPDLALAEGAYGYRVGGVQMLLGAGKDQFEGPIFTDTKGSYSIAAADFDEDGHLDVAISTNSGTEVLLGDGKGGFGSPIQVLSLPAQSPEILVGDFNNDGHQDLVLLANGFLQSDPIYVFLGKGNGTFELANQFWNSSSIPGSIAAADFNHDGKLDLVLTMNPSGIAVMLGNGDGTFQAPVTYATDDIPGGLAVADVNGDGIPDVLATGDYLDIFIGKGDGTFAQAVDLVAGNFPGNVTTGDFNGDGKLDIAVAAEGTGAMGNLEILLGEGGGKFQAPVEIACRGCYSGLFVAGDLNQDGTTDLVGGQGSGLLYLSAPIATIAPTALNFGMVKVGHASAAKKISITNNGNAPLDISAITVPFAYHVVDDDCGSSLAARASCTLKVSFKPTSTGSDPGVLLFSDNAPGGQQSIVLAGQGK